MIYTPRTVDSLRCAHLACVQSLFEFDEQLTVLVGHFGGRVVEQVLDSVG
jgi:hypothetical protein